MIQEAAREGLRTLRTHRLRSALTLVCVVWGSASVVFLSAWGTGAARMVEASYERVGRNLLQVTTGRIGEDYTPATDRRRIVAEWSDARFLARRMRLADGIAAETRFFAQVSAGSRAYEIDVHGVELDAFAIRGTRVAAGRSLLPTDLRERRAVAVIGHAARERLFGSGPATGRALRIDGQPFEVVGVLARVGTQLWRGGPTEIDDQVWIPISSSFALQTGTDDLREPVSQILVRLPHRDLQAAAESEIRVLLGSRFRVSATDTEAIQIASPLDLLRVIPLDEAQLMLTGIAAMTLLVGGIGVLNLMLESVQERRREIGVRMALGAARRDVVEQFFLESLVVTGVGGLAGVVVGSLLAFGLSLLELPDLIPLPVLQPRAVLVTLTLLVGVGLVAGVVPALRAAGVDPAESLRAE